MTFMFMVVGWAVCGVISYGLEFGRLQGKYPFFGWLYRRDDQMAAAIMALSGPVGLGVGWFLYEGYPIRWRVISREDSLRAYEAKWPRLRDEDWQKLQGR